MASPIIPSPSILNLKTTGRGGGGWQPCYRYRYSGHKKLPKGPAQVQNEAEVQMTQKCCRCKNSYKAKISPKNIGQWPRTWTKNSTLMNELLLDLKAWSLWVMYTWLSSKNETEKNRISGLCFLSMLKKSAPKSFSQGKTLYDTKSPKTS